MANGGFLVPPSERPEGSEIWEETWKRVDRFLPNLFAEIFPEVHERSPLPSTGNAEQSEGDSPIVKDPPEKEQIKQTLE